MGRLSSEHTRRLSFAPAEDCAATETRPQGEREGQLSQILLQATTVSSELLWESLRESVGHETCMQTDIDKRRENEYLNASRLATLSPGVRSQIVQAIIDGVSAQVETNVGTAISEDSETSEVLTSICVIRRSILVMQLYNLIWLDSSSMEDDSSGYLISHGRKLRLLRWSIVADATFDPVTEFDTILRTIVGAEKTLITLTQINKPFLISAKRSAQVSRVITRFFLLGFWDQALGLLKRCYSYPDDATSEFISMVRSHFPPESYVCDDLDNDRHPMNHPIPLARFRETLRTSFASAFRLSDDHLLRRILLVLCDLPDPDEDSAWDASMDDTREGPEVLAEIFMSGDEHEQILCFATSLFWLGHQMEGCCHSAPVRLAEQNAIGFIFQKWWHARSCHETQCAVADVAYALLLGNDTDKLLDHLNAYWWYFLPLLPMMVAFFAFYDFDLSEDQMLSSLLPSSLDAADQIQDTDAFTAIADQNICTMLRPYIVTTRAIAEVMHWSMPHLLTLGSENINTPQRVIAHRYVLEAIAANLQAKSHLRGKLLTRLLDAQDAFTPFAFFLAIELAQDSSDFFQAWVPPPDEPCPSLDELKSLPSWPFKMSIQALQWSTKVLTERAIESHSMEALRQHPYLTERALGFLQGPLLPMKLVEVAVTVEFANATSSKASVDTSARVAGLLMKLLEHITATERETDDTKIWKMLHQLAVEKNVHLPREFVEQSILRHYNRLCVCDEKRDSKLRTLRALSLAARDTPSTETFMETSQVRVCI